MWCGSVVSSSLGGCGVGRSLVLCWVGGVWVGR